MRYALAWGLVVALALVAPALAGTTPVTANGTTYYIVQEQTSVSVWEETNLHPDLQMTEITLEDGTVIPPDDKVA